jgi:pyrroline-5-carboxylate reductase
MTHTESNGSVVLVGCGRLGSAILEGWLATSTVAPADLIILTPSDKPATEAARARGARINPPLEALTGARALVLAVKPAKWREALAPTLDHLPADTPVISVMAGVKAADIGALAGRPVARVMPTTAVAQARGVAGLWSDDDAARETARSLFAAIADVVDLPAESAMDAATATAGSAPAFVYAFVQALARAGEAQGLSRDAAERLARGALRSAGAGAETGAPLEELVARIASPGGTTRAGLDAMEAGGDLDRAARAAVDAAVARARDISG